MSVAPDLPVWAQWFAALAVPVAAVVAAIIGILNYYLSATKRKDELFDRRLDFYKRFMNEIRNPEKFHIGGILIKRVNLKLLTVEGEFLFGNDISNHLEVVEEWVGDPQSKHRFEDIVAPFRKYMKL